MCGTLNTTYLSIQCFGLNFQKKRIKFGCYFCHRFWGLLFSWARDYGLCSDLILNLCVCFHCGLRRRSFVFFVLLFVVIVCTLILLWKRYVVGDNSTYTYGFCGFHLSDSFYFIPFGTVSFLFVWDYAQASSRKTGIVHLLFALLDANWNLFWATYENVVIEAEHAERKSLIGATIWFFEVLIIKSCMHNIYRCWMRTTSQPYWYRIDDSYSKRSNDLFMNEQLTISITIIFYLYAFGSA